MDETVTLTKAECLALYELIDELSGCNAESVFAWDDTDTLNDPKTKACVKVYHMAGALVPDKFKEFLAAVKNAR